MLSEATNAPSATQCWAKPMDSDTPGSLARLITKELAPQVLDIDLKGHYPEVFLRRLGETQGFGGAVSPAFGGTGEGLGSVIAQMEAVSGECLSTGFLIWCQSSCAWYLDNSDNLFLKREVLPKLCKGELLGGTGLSNLLKSRSGIETLRLSARVVPGGYRITGTLPWVSNLGLDHVFSIAAALDDGNTTLMGLVRGDAEGLTLRQNAHFVALEGTATMACQFQDVYMPYEMVICAPEHFDAYFRRIRAGLILAQMGMGLGLADACVQLMKEANTRLYHVNRYLDDQVEDIEAALILARQRTYALARRIDRQRDGDGLMEILELRIAGSELALRAAQAAMLHMGAKGYLLRSPAQRRLREAYFVAIVSPALKHLKKELHALGSQDLASSGVA